MSKLKKDLYDTEGRTNPRYRKVTKFNKINCYFANADLIICRNTNLILRQQGKRLFNTYLTFRFYGFFTSRGYSTLGL